MTSTLANGHIVKIGIVTEDADATAAALRSIFPVVDVAETGAPPAFTVRPFTEYHGKRADRPVKLKVANVHTENFWFEIIEPDGDTPNPWRDHLEAHGTSVCFTSIHVEGGFEEQAQRMTALGHPLIWFEEKGYERYGYFETTDTLGFLVEVKERVAR